MGVSVTVAERVGDGTGSCVEGDLANTAVEENALNKITTLSTIRIAISFRGLSANIGSSRVLSATRIVPLIVKVTR